MRKGAVLQLKFLQSLCPVLRPCPVALPCCVAALRQPPRGLGREPGTGPTAKGHHALRALSSFAVSNSGGKRSEPSSGVSRTLSPAVASPWGERPPRRGRAPTYVASLLPAALPPCRQRAGSPRRRRSPSAPCTRCCTPRASRRWLGACSRSSTLLRTPGLRSCKPCGSKTRHCQYRHPAVPQLTPEQGRSASPCSGCPSAALLRRRAGPGTSEASSRRAGGGQSLPGAGPGQPLGG